ncbi:HK97 family phage prohead protease [Methylobrevis albus]|uniref:HK97 family phage prohead protease n=1 Tax=Methylobrevis albus TaxID=2793297 RepID=A0A931I443_9HYPH|nr:HK97 family phage prohead protease [Methylobrevis albus]MBH0239129.1 HK97 family phage prohead protease [Methylobrevis albus]
MPRETRTLSPTEIRLDGDEGRIEGYAAVFNVVVPSFNETVAPGAFRRSLAEHRASGTRPVMLYHHGQDVVGVWESIEEDSRGLKVRGRIIRETVKGAETFALLREGALSGLSIGFSTRKAERNPAGVRVLRDVDLAEISIVPLPASPSARITSVRSIADASTYIVALKSVTNSLKGLTK